MEGTGVHEYSLGTGRTAVHWNYGTFWSGLDAVRQFDWLSGYRWPLARDHTLGCAIHQHVGEPTPLSLSTAGMYAGELCATMGNYWYKSNLRNIPTSLWRGTEWSGGLVVLKRSFTVSLRLLDVFSGFCVGVVCCFGWFCLWTSSLLHIYLLSNSLRSVDRRCHELDRQTLQKIPSSCQQKINQPPAQWRYWAMQLPAKKGHQTSWPSSFAWSFPGHCISATEAKTSRRFEKSEHSWQGLIAHGGDAFRFQIELQRLSDFQRSIFSVVWEVGQESFCQL